MVPPSSIDMAWSAGYASFAENASDPLMSHTLEGRGCSDDDLSLPLTDLLAGPAHDNTSWVNGAKGVGMPSEIEWESFLSFGAFFTCSRMSCFILLRVKAVSRVKTWLQGNLSHSHDPQTVLCFVPQG